MPELPEVQTIANDLNQKIQGAKIVDFWTDWESALRLPLEKFKKAIIGAKIEKAARRAKNLLIFLDNGKIIWIHPKMTGHLLVKDANGSPENAYFAERVNGYIHHRWTLKLVEKKKEILNSKDEIENRDETGNFSLEFSDLRKFGRINLLDKKDYQKSKELANLGAEPLEDDFDFEKFKAILESAKNKSIRIALMDQNLIVGIGNIYVSEILFESGISPDRKIADLKEKEKKEIFKNIKKILFKALELRGTSESDFRDTDGAPGTFQNVLKVYGKEGGKCPKKSCVGTIKRKKIAQRSSFWCDVCQK